MVGGICCEGVVHISQQVPDSFHIDGNLQYKTEESAPDACRSTASEDHAAVDIAFARDGDDLLALPQRVHGQMAIGK